MISRRTLIQSAPPAIAALSVGGAASAEDMSSSAARVQYFADAIGKEPPARLLSADGGPSPEILAFCRETDMSLDWAFVGDLRPVFRAAHRNHVALNSVGSTVSTDPHSQWYKRWLDLHHDMNTEPGALADHDPRLEESYALEGKIAATPAKTVEGIAAQATLAAHPDFGLVDDVTGTHDCVLLRSLADALNALTLETST
jgi:hypothetical protein